ncbi:hypothetical protein ACFWFI_01210 [Streptomyces sp. NPDC060209]|uniref:hypothetical protein n=1 Tax=Streptomyces sp. NPDC060209 TaxID=3347073 RepID=UPI00364EA870
MATRRSGWTHSTEGHIPESFQSESGGLKNKKIAESGTERLVLTAVASSKTMSAAFDGADEEGRTPSVLRGAVRPIVVAGGGQSGMMPG